MIWWCLFISLGSIGLLAAYTFYLHHRQQGNEHSPVGPLAIKFALSVILIIILIESFKMGPLGVFIAILPGFVLGLIWVGPLTDWLGMGVINSFMGGGEKVEPKPMYSIAETKQKRGDPHGAIAEIESELETFPGDFDGLMLKATIQMENLHDFDSAQATVQAIVQQPQYEPGQVSRALGRLADWQLRFKADPEAARLTLCQLRDRFSGTAVEFTASQRLARMDFVIEIDDRREASVVVSECLKQLEKHPLDNDTREKLARVYFERYGQPELAKEEMKKLFAIPFQQPRDLARWLNLMADWHLKKDNPEAARECLRQIVARYPNLPYCEEAQQRLTRIKER
jgi:hypothetical protein